MSERAHVPLFANILIDNQEKLDLFKVTMCDAGRLFEEAHLKVRGRFGGEAVDFARRLPFERLFVYQHLQNRDWVAAAIDMLEHIKSRSVFLFFEDHRLVAPREVFLSVVNDFESLELDYLCYSWFRASQLQARNLLPLYHAETPHIWSMECNAASMELLGRISPGYYLFSLMSIVSVQYLKTLLMEENRRFKMYARVGTMLAARLFPYPQYKRVYMWLNGALRPFNVRVCVDDPSSPFNLEHIWFESAALVNKLRVGISKQELFANFDDDNGAVGESLIKRGFYPFRDGGDVRPEDITGGSVHKRIELSEGQFLDLAYHSAVGRIRRAPVVRVRVMTGQADLRWAEGAASLEAGDTRAVYSNKGAELVARSAAVVDVEIFDEVF